MKRIYFNDSKPEKQIRKCSVEGCETQYYAKGHCFKHYSQIRNYGKIFKRTKFDPNEFIFEDEICKIQIYDRKNNPKCQAIIDTEDYERVKDYKWHFNHKTQTVGGSLPNSNSKIYISRLIMNVTDPQTEVDHKNHDKLDNRKQNLRICSRSQNQKNQRILKSNTSGYKGVSWCPKSNKWVSKISVNNKTVHLGLFTDKKQAAHAYNRASKKYHGEFGLINTLI